MLSIEAHLLAGSHVADTRFGPEIDYTVGVDGAFPSDSVVLASADILDEPIYLGESDGGNASLMEVSPGGGGGGMAAANQRPVAPNVGGGRANVRRWSPAIIVSLIGAALMLIVWVTVGRVRGRS